MDMRALMTAFCAWAVPGLGHVVLGRWSKAVYFFLLITSLFALGVWLGGGGSVSAARFPFHIYGQYGAGLPAFVASWIGAGPLHATIDRLELGVLMTTVAGILNIIVVVDAYEIARLDSSKA
jgi:hypothetical protein